MKWKLHMLSKNTTLCQRAPYFAQFNLQYFRKNWIRQKGCTRSFLADQNDSLISNALFSYSKQCWRWRITDFQSMSDRRSKDRQSRSATIFSRSDLDRRSHFAEKIAWRSAIAKSTIGIAKTWSLLRSLLPSATALVSIC